MLFRTLGLCLLFASLTASAQGRKPAVEDFVGIDVAQPEVTPQGTESLYNFEKDLSKKIASDTKPAYKAAPAPVKTTGWSVTSLFVVALFIGLPLGIWMMIMAHLKKKASLESASNIEVLENYRRERERKNQRSIRKAS